MGDNKPYIAFDGVICWPPIEEATYSGTPLTNFVTMNEFIGVHLKNCLVFVEGPDVVARDSKFEGCVFVCTHLNTARSIVHMYPDLDQAWGCVMVGDKDLALKLFDKARVKH